MEKITASVFSVYSSVITIIVVSNCCSAGRFNPLTLKAQKKIAAEDTLLFYFYLCKEIMLDVSYESFA